MLHLKTFYITYLLFLKMSLLFLFLFIYFFSPLIEFTYIIEWSAQGQVLHCKRRNLDCSSAKAGLPSQIQEPRLVFYKGLNRCDSFGLLSAPHSLFSIGTGLKRSEKIPRGTNVEVRWVDLASWALRTSPKFITGVKLYIYKEHIRKHKAMIEMY